MKKMLTMLAAVLFVGCDFTVPLVTKPAIEIDKSILGLWQTTGDDGKTEQLLVLPLDKNEYLVSYPTESKDGKFFSKDGMFFKGCLCRTDDKTLVQLKWLGTADGKTPDDNRVYLFLNYSVSGDKLTIRQLNNDVVNKDAASTKELAKSIAANRDNPQLFKAAGVFTRSNNP